MKRCEIVPIVWPENVSGPDVRPACFRHARLNAARKVLAQEVNR